MPRLKRKLKAEATAQRSASDNDVTCILTGAGDPSPVLCFGAFVTEPDKHAGHAATSVQTPKRRSLHASALGELVLSYYPADHVMAGHAHDVDQRSIILSGALAEDTPSHSARPGASHRGFKAAGVVHENRYGPQGALILALNTAPRADQGSDWGWSPIANASQVCVLLSALVRQPQRSDGTLEDLLAVLSGPSQAALEREIPDWLSRTRDAVHDDPDGADLQALADEAGVHRVHLSRAYSRHFHAPLSLDRRRARLARAVRALMEEGATAAEAAFGAGFSDQPHFARTLKTETGLTPRVLMRVLTDTAKPPTGVTSVQDRVCRSAYRAAS